MLMALIVYCAAYMTAKATSEALPVGFGFSVLAALAAIVAAAIAGIATAVLLSGAATANDLVASALVHATIAAIAAPFVVWHTRRKRRAAISG